VKCHDVGAVHTAGDPIQLTETGLAQASGIVGQLMRARAVAPRPTLERNASSAALSASGEVEANTESRGAATRSGGSMAPPPPRLCLDLSEQQNKLCGREGKRVRVQESRGGDIAMSEREESGSRH
jgi:hypothetical protein